MSTAKLDSTQDGKPHKPGLTLIEVLVALIMVGVLAAVFVPKIIRRHREAAFVRGLMELNALDSDERLNELIAAYPESVEIRLGRWGYTLLHHAAQTRNVELAKFLVSRGADLNASAQPGDATSLGFAVDTTRLPKWRRMISGDDRDIPRCPGTTPLHIAAADPCPDMAEWLLSKGADLNAEDSEGSTPVDIAKSPYRLRTLELLKQHGASVGAIPTREEWLRRQGFIAAVPKELDSAGDHEP